MESVLYVLVEVIRNVAILTTPFMPQSMEKVFVQLGVPEDGRGFGQLGLAHALVPGTPLAGKPVPIFPRFVDEDAG